MTDAEDSEVSSSEVNDRSSVVDDTDKITIKAVRAMLGLNNANVAITRANLQKLAWEDVGFSKVGFDGVMEKANSILEAVYGLSIRKLPPREVASKNGKRETRSAQYILVNDLSDSYLKFLLESQWLPKSNALFQSELMEKRHDYRNSKERAPSLASDEQLVFSGLALTVISLIVVSNDHMNEVELLTLFDKLFGVKADDTLEILNYSLIDLFKQLDKAEYVVRTSVKASDNEEIVEYSVGRRAKEEFDRDSFVEFIKILYDEQEDNPQFLAQINATLEATYGKPEQV